jgi:DNA-binding SARP family transcriptional activator
VEYRILGPLEVSEGGTVLSIPGAKERAVLALLLVHAGEIVPADRLVDQVWGDESPGSARRSLRVRMAHLRTALGADRILTRPPGYLLHVEREALDLDRFQRLLADSDGVEPAIASERLREALALWRGPALADFRYESWAAAPTARLEELRVVALEKRIDADLALGRHAALVGELEAVVIEHPLRERFRAQLMLALYRAERQAEALDVYQRTRREFVGELGLEPGPALQELERAILGQDPSLALERSTVPERSILVVGLATRSMNGLVALAGPLARQPDRELILVRPVASRVDLADASAEVGRHRDGLLADGIQARAATFTSAAYGQDAVRIANEQDVDLLLVDGTEHLLDDSVLALVLDAAPCDVGVLVDRKLQVGPVLVPFVGAEHDWSAVEIGAWIARSQELALQLAGPGEGPRDASRLLADASLVVQRALGVVADPVIVEPGPDDLVQAAADAALVVAGLSDRWRKEGLGPVRSALVSEARPPVLLVRRGLRPGGLAPPESHTRFTWSVRPAT